MNPGIWFSIGCMTGYDFVYEVQADFTECSHQGIVNAMEIGCIDAPNFIPAGGMRFADSFIGQVQIQAIRP